MDAQKLNTVICFFNSCKEWGGGEKWHLEMARRLHSKGKKVILCAYPGSPLYQKGLNENLNVVPFKVGNLGFLNFALQKQLVRFFRNNSISHLIMNMSADVKTAGRAAKKANVPHIIYRRGSAIPIKDSISNRYLFGNIITNIIANSDETRRTILANHSQLFDEKKIHVIYNGIDLSEYNELGNKKNVNEGHDIVLGNAGRLEKQKNQKFLIELAELLNKRGYKVKLKICGSGRLEEDLKKTVERKNLDSQVEFMGFVDDMKAFYESIDVFVLSSLWEGFGYVLVEAYACARPVVAFNVSSNPEIVDNGKDGILVPVNDLYAFYDAVERLIDHPELRISMGQSGRQKVFNKFDVEVTTTKLMDYLENIDS